MDIFNLILIRNAIYVQATIYIEEEMENTISIWLLAMKKIKILYGR